MFKQFISALLIFSILYSDMAYCGNGCGRCCDDEGESQAPRTKRTSGSDSQEEEGRLLTLPPSDPLDFPPLSQDFLEIARGSSQGESLPLRQPHPLTLDLSGDEGDPLIPTTPEESDTDEIFLQDDSKKTAPSPRKQALKGQGRSQKGRELQIFPSDSGENGGLSSGQAFSEFQAWVKKSKPNYTDRVLALASLEDPRVGAATKQCLNHLQERIVEGKLNKKQMAALLLGLGVGGGIVAMTYVEFYVLYMVALDFDILYWLITHDLFNSYWPITYISMCTMAIDATSRITSLLSDFMKESTQSFSIQKTNAHSRSLLYSKLCLYGCSTVMSTVPGYYLYELIACKNKGQKDCGITNDLLFEVLFAATLLDRTLHFGHQLSHHAEHEINHYFSPKVAKGLTLSAIDQNQQTYLEKFKDLERMIYESQGATLSDLYGAIFKKEKEELTTRILDKDTEGLNIKEALRILRLLNNFHSNVVPDLVPEKSETWKTTAASWVGRGMTLLATPGRHLAFWYAMNEILEDMHKQKMVSDITQVALSIFLGGVMAGVIQGIVEIDALKKATYNLLWGKKIPPGSSHYPLRILIKIWDYFSATASSIPYIAAGISAVSGIGYHADYVPPPEGELPWPLWAKLTCLIPFCITGITSTAAALHESNLKILNAFDSLMSYWYPFEGYKRDKLVRITHELHELFKKLDPDVLKTVDRLLNERQRDPHLTDFEEIDNLPEIEDF